MNSELIIRVVNLVQKNGDRVVLADAQSGKAVVVMDLEAYERLSGNVVNVPVHVALPTETIESAPRIPPSILSTFSQQKEAKKKPAVKSEITSAFAGLGDLTQEQLLDKINRDIGNWKTEQGRRHTDALKSAVQQPSSLESGSVVEDEEKFYLEPIE